MTARKPLSLAVGLLLTAAAFLPAGATQTVAGSWTLRPAETQDKVQLAFVQGRSMDSSSDWRLAALTGLDLSPLSRHDVHFAIERDAGRIDAEGSAASGTAAGSFQFSPAPGYADELRKLGLGEIRPEAQLSFALHDVSLAFGREMIGLGVTNLTAEKLMAMRIHGATPEWVAGLGQLGYGNGTTSAEQLIAFRIHGVTPDYVAAIEKLGYARPAPDQLITMRIHGVTPDYIASVKAKGVRDTSLDQLVAMKIHGID